MRSHIASGLSMKLVLSSLSMTTVRPSGTAPMGGTTKIVIWVTMIAETISAAAIAISLRILNSFSVAPACHSYLGKPVSSLQRLRIPRQPLTGCRLKHLILPNHHTADRGVPVNPHDLVWPIRVQGLEVALATLYHKLLERGLLAVVELDDHH